MDQQELRKRIVEINQDPNLTDEEKARKRQQLLSGKWMSQDASTNKASDAGGKYFEAGRIYQFRGKQRK